MSTEHTAALGGQMGEPEYIAIAAQMLGVGTFAFRGEYRELAKALDHTADFCEKAGGQLVSRQAIAAVIEGFLRSQRAE